MEFVMDFVKRLGYMWYIMDPKDHLFEKVSDVPDYYKEVTPAFIFVIVLEQALNLLRGKRMMRINDSVANISQGIIVELFKIPLHGVELILYTWIYSNWRICSLPWDSPLVWLLCAVTTDFFFYWMHRATHQISILWLFHEPHHSSEDFNLTTPMRLSIFTSASFWLTYLPMALLVPPATFLVHYQLVIIFQYWLHSEYIPRLGVLEYILVTPSHHRVHHGRSRRCIDKNFGSLFIVWDRFFGTFEPEGDEKIVFGVTKPLQTFNPIHIQTNHLQTIWKRLGSVDGLLNNLSLIFKGPGWSPGAPWLGNLEDIPEPKENETKYDPTLPRWLKIYVILHVAGLVLGYLQMSLFLAKVPSWLVYVSGSYMVFTAVAVGCILDNSSWAIYLELLRCPLYFLLDVLIRRVFPPTTGLYPLLYASLYAFRSLFFASFVFWIFAIPLTLKYKSGETAMKHE